MCRATVKEYTQFTKRVREFGECLKYAIEWQAAILFGWDHDEFVRLYIAYLESTQVKCEDHPGVSMLDLKGRPLERLATFFLKHGGVVLDLKEISVIREWQVDGQGLLNRTGIINCFGATEAQNFGPQLYMESKNHVTSISNSDYSLHCNRMNEHRCNIGVIFSSSGYSIASGSGIARSVFNKTLQGVFNILFTVDVFKKIIDEDKPPLLLIREVYAYAVNEMYSSDTELQSRYSKERCHKIAKEEYSRYCSRSIK